MQDLILELILGVTSNALFSVATSRIAADGQRAALRDALHDRARSIPSLRETIEAAVEAVGTSHTFMGRVGTERLEHFLKSPESESLARQAFATSTLTDGPTKLADLEAEFRESFQLSLGEQSDDLAAVGSALFRAVIASCEEQLRLAAEHFGNGPQALLDILHTRVLQGELATIRKNLAFLQSHARPNISDVLAFEEKYRAQVADRHGHIVPPNVDQALKVPIDSLYVQPSLFRIKRGAEQHRIGVDHLLSDLHRCVILGQPGGGKSTTAHKICHNLATRYEDKPCCSRTLTPILVVLKDYGAEKKVHAVSILQFIERTAAARYQLEPPQGAFPYLLLNGRAMVIFDGLDELLDTRDRAEITSDVESFCNAYPSVPVLVTSREVGYEQAPLRTRLFDAYRLAPFAEPQVTEYVTKWFSADDTLDDLERKQKIDGFLRESRFAPDLRSNPLMLSLMCRIYRGENYIPQNRPDVYEKCATMLFEQWDRGRGIHLTGAVASIAPQIRPAIMHLAYWIYGDDSLQTGVTEEQLTERVVAWLTAHRFEDVEYARVVAAEFVSFLRGRAWVLSESGTTPSGERLWSFTHRTFLEYFAAYQLVRLYSTPEALAAVLLPRIAREEWDVVAQLALQIQQRTVESGGDRVLELILARQTGIPRSRRYPYISFTVRTLGFASPPPAIVREVTRASLHWVYEDATAGRRQRTRKRVGSRRPVRPSVPDERLYRSPRVLGELVSCADQNRETVSAVFKQFVADALSTGSAEQQVAAVDMAVHCWWNANMFGMSPGSEVDPHYWLETTDSWLTDHIEQVKRLGSTVAPWILNELFIRRLITWRDYISARGVRGFFTRGGSSAITPDAVVFSLAEQILLRSLSSLQTSDRIDDEGLQQLRDIGSTLTSTPVPWIRGPWTVLSSAGLLRAPGSRPASSIWAELTTFDADALFSVLGLFCAHVESSLLRSERAGRFRTGDSTDVFAAIAQSRSEPGVRARVEEALHETPLSLGQRELLEGWVRGEAQFTTPRAQRTSASAKTKRPGDSQ